MGTIAARDCVQILDMSEQVAAICTLAMVQAADLRGLASAGPGLVKLHAHVRAHVPFNDHDRAMEDDIAWILDELRSDRLPLGDYMP